MVVFKTSFYGRQWANLNNIIVNHLYWFAIYNIYYTHKSHPTPPASTLSLTPFEIVIALSRFTTGGSDFIPFDIGFFYFIKRLQLRSPFVFVFQVMIQTGFLIRLGIG